MPENNYAHLGLARIIKSNRITNYKNLGPLFKWVDGRVYLLFARFTFLLFLA